ncbi:MAG: ABC transporter permease [Flavobacteriaceae bacterium]
MIKNNLKIAWRNVIKSKGLFLINVIGLAIGLATCLIILLFVADELSYDCYNEKANEIVRVVFKAKINGEEIREAIVMPPVAHTLQREFPEVLEATRLKRISNPKVTYNNTAYRTSTFAYVDSNFFDIFSLPIIEGDKNTPLNEPNTIILTQNEAVKYFGKTNPIGQVLDIDDLQFTVTAIIDEVPDNSHFHFDMFASMTGYKNARNTSWMDSGYHSYLVLKKGSNSKDLEAKLPAIIKKYMGPQMKAEIGMSFDEFTKDGDIGLFLQPLADIHLKSNFSSASTLEKGGDIKAVYIFSAVALFMLLIACINFMNLSTASSTKRAKEVGIRKVLGSNKKQLIGQFLMESFIATTVSTIVALVLVVLMLPMFNVLSGKELQITYLLSPKIMGAILGLVVFISLLAGWFPAFSISSFNPISALKNKFSGTGKTKGIRSGLVIFQFVVSVGLIIATIIVEQQMSFIRNKDIGYEKEQLLVLREAYFLGANKDAFKNQIRNDSRVTNVTTSAFVPSGRSDINMTGIYINHKFDRRTNIYNIDEEYIPTMGMEISKGRNFSTAFGADSLGVIVNETTVKKLGFGNDPINRTITIHIGDIEQNHRVIGVVKDFNFHSLRQEIAPLIMLNKPYGGLIVRANVAEMAGLIESITALWDAYNVEEPFSYTVLNESYKATYLADDRMGNILQIFALLTIFIACLGLFGLVTFTAEQRFKEIGIRKVLGSSVPQIVSLLAKDFLKLVVISMGLAFPLGYYFMNKWLEDFAYRIEIKWWVFALAGLIAVFVAFATISYRSVQAALMNPVRALKAE